MRQYPPSYWTDAALIQDIAKAIQGEYEAIQYYARLAMLAPNPVIRQTILDIRNDEIRHFNRFSRTYVMLTGRSPEVTPGPMPVTFMQGVQYAYNDETKAAAFYQRIASSTSMPRIQRQFYRASQDEQRHAAYFRSLMR